VRLSQVSAALVVAERGEDLSMTMPGSPNGASPPKKIAPGMHVAPSPMSFEVAAGWTQSTPPQRIVRLHIEHMTGSGDYMMDAEFAGAIARALLAASSGIQIAKN
jgi:hypothetical protein